MLKKFEGKGRATTRPFLNYSVAKEIENYLITLKM